jgi:hypothetical protein
LKSTFNKPAGCALPSACKICANKRFIRIVFASCAGIMSQSFARVPSLQVQYQLGAYLLTVVSTSRWGIERVDAGAVDQAAHRVHLLSAETWFEQRRDRHERSFQ